MNDVDSARAEQAEVVAKIKGWFMGLIEFMEEIDRDIYGRNTHIGE